MSIMRLWTVVFVAAAAAGPYAGRALATDIAALAALLGSDDWASRNAADAELRYLEPPGLDAIAPLLSRTDLSPEQALRLRDIALDRFRRGPHAALGISLPVSVDDGFDAGRAQPFVVSGLVPGFDAESKLKDRDVVEAMDGVPIRNPDVMRAAILSHAPGEVATLTVLRGAARLELRVTLGDFAALREGARLPDAGTIEYAFSLYMARRGGWPLLAPPPALEGPAPRARPAGPTPRAATAPLPGVDDELVGLMVGGEAHGRMATPSGGFGQPRRLMRLVAPAGGQPREDRRSTLERRRDELRTQIELLQTIINRPIDPRLPAAERAQASGATEMARQELNRLNDQARRIAAELERLPR